MPIVQTSHTNTNYVADHLSEECPALHDMERDDLQEMVYETAYHSPLSYCIEANGVPVALFGADGDPGDAWGSAWLFYTNDVKNASIKFELIRSIKLACQYSRTLWPELRIIPETRTPFQDKFVRAIGFTKNPEGEYVL